MNKKVETEEVPANTFKQKKEMSIYKITIIIMVIVSLIFVWVLIIGNEPIDIIDKNTAICVAEESLLYVSAGCGYCLKQKQALGDNLEMFDIIDCMESPDICVSANIGVVPTWIINGDTYMGYRDIEQLKEISGC